MPTVIIKTNASQISDVTIRDLGIIIPASGGSETFTDVSDLHKVKISLDLRTLATDDAHGTGSSTLILNNGTSDIDQDRIDVFLNNTAAAISQPLSLVIGGTLDILSLPFSGLAAEIVAVASEFTTFQARRGVAGTAGTTTIQLEIDGSAVSGATLSWTSSDVANTLKQVDISETILEGSRISLLLSSAETDAEDIFAAVK